MSRSSKLAGVLSDSDLLAASVDLRAALDEAGGFNVARGTFRSELFGSFSDGDDYFFGRGGNDTMEGGAGTDIVSGGEGKDTMDTGSGLGVHIGGKGADTYRIGDDILDNSENDTIIAFGFKAAQRDVLDLGETITAVVQQTLYGEDPGVLTLSEGGDFGDIIAALEGVRIAGDKDLKAFQKFLTTADETGFIDNAATISVANGDKIVVTGVDVAKLIALLTATVPPPSEG